MKAEEIINQLKIKKIPFELKENQVVIRLARRYFLKLYIENDHIVKEEDVVKTFGLLTKGKSLIVYTKTGLTGYLIFILLIVLWYIFEPDLFYTPAGQIFVTAIIMGITGQLLEFLYYNRRLSKIKKTLNLRG
jgi:hypothetical protein